MSSEYSNHKSYIDDDVTTNGKNTISLLSKPNKDNLMSEKEIKEIKKGLRRVKKDATNKEYSISVLKKIGILTKSGKVAEQYQTLCTPSHQD